jgi:hypothetical protein
MRREPRRARLPLRRRRTAELSGVQYGPSPSLIKLMIGVGIALSS